MVNQNIQQMSDTNPTSWVSAHPPRSNHRKASLLCFPFAGGGTVAFHPWKKLLHPDIALLLVQLPGREMRLREEPFRSLTPLIEALVSELIPWLKPPFAFYGHSMGALIVFEVTRMLRDMGAPIPSHLFVSSFRAPHLPDPDYMIAKLPENEFIEKLKQYDGIAPAILSNPELMEIFLPILKADFNILASYHYTQKEPLPCPITAFAGLSDPKVNKEQIEAWQDHTTGRFDSYFFPGGHFFMNGSQTEVLKLINRYLDQQIIR